MSISAIDIQGHGSRLQAWTNELWARVFTLSVHSQSGESEEETLQQIAAARSGDGDAFGQLVEKYQAAIGLQMMRFSRQQSDIEDLVHETFVEAYLSLSSFNARSPFLHWLRKIAVRVGYRYWKRRAKERDYSVSIIDLETHEASSDQAEVPSSEPLTEIMQQLKPRNRLVLTLLYWDGCSVAEAAELTGWSRTMVKVQAHRARQRVKKLIEESRDD